jgi:hypothetical protein
MKPIVITRMLGGLGNQLFAYATGRALAERTHARLVLDHSGFFRDPYGSPYSLGTFPVKAAHLGGSLRRPGPGWFLRTLLRRGGGRLARGVVDYLVEDPTGKESLDRRILECAPVPVRYVDGYWQNRQYFEPIADQIRQELTPFDAKSIVEDRIPGGLGDGVLGIHFRRVTFATGELSPSNLSHAYYERALAVVRSRGTPGRIAVFSDAPDQAQATLVPLLERAGFGVIPTVWIRGRKALVAKEMHWDLWLMSRCAQLIMANSTYGWWAGWLGERPGRTVVVPDPAVETNLSSWNLGALFMPTWVAV